MQLIGKEGYLVTRITGREIRTPGIYSEPGKPLTSHTSQNEAHTDQCLPGGEL